MENDNKNFHGAKALKTANRYRWCGADGLPNVRHASAQQTISLKMQSTWPTKDIFHEIFVDWARS